MFADYEPGTKASAVYNRFSKEAARRFVECEGLTTIDFNQLTYVNYGDINIRIRKLESNSLAIARNDTEMMDLWTTGGQTILPGFADKTLQLILGYSPDVLWHNISQCILGLFRFKTPISYREIAIDEIGFRPVQFPFVGPTSTSGLPLVKLEFRKTVDAPLLEEETS